ncbi:MAG: hypothetical protein KA436_05270 [Oligoflexales bacterium]|nr:hypothetical protein [Oligoflexales bacterium]
MGTRSLCADDDGTFYIPPGSYLDLDDAHPSEIREWDRFGGGIYTEEARQTRKLLLRYESLLELNKENRKALMELLLRHRDRRESIPDSIQVTIVSLWDRSESYLRLVGEKDNYRSRLIAYLTELHRVHLGLLVYFRTIKEGESCFRNRLGTEDRLLGNVEPVNDELRVLLYSHENEN